MSLRAEHVDYVSPAGDTWCESCTARRFGADQRARARGAEAGLQGALPWANPYGDHERELRRHWEEMRARVARTVREAQLAGAVEAC